MENLYLIVGLGNPGAEYARTRHNAGFEVVQRLAARWKASWAYEKRFNVSLARAELGERRVLLCQPQTYMNASGEAIGPLAAFYRIDTGRILVVVDDADLPLGQLRMRPGGSSGGHHGLESIEQHLGTREYARLRVGIGRLGTAREIKNYVLGRFSPEETAVAAKVLDAAADQAHTWVEAGVQTAMNRFNGLSITGAPGSEDK
jgi:PTH1 family peptidyl-tRNA hydrolase